MARRTRRPAATRPAASGVIQRAISASSGRAVGSSPSPLMSPSSPSAASSAARLASAMRAIAHPVRLRILSLLTGTAMSAAEVARELGLTHANASYHLRLLADADELVVDGEEKIRGGVAKRYRYPHERDLEPGEPGAQRRPGAPSAYLSALGKELERRSRSRRTTLPRTSRPLTRTPPRPSA